MSNEELILGRLDEMVKLLGLLAKRGVSQAAIIHELAEQGFGPKRIAQLLGTTANTVSVGLHRKRSMKTRKKNR